MTIYNKNIIIAAQVINNYKKSINKKINILSSDIFQHSQLYLTNNWNLINDEDPKDFGEAFEDPQFVEPTYTSFDYSEDVLENPKDFGESNESPNLINPTPTTFDYSQDDIQDPSDTAIPDLG